MIEAKRVFVFGLDGVAGWAMREAYTPHINYLFKDGVIMYTARTVYPSSSFEAWGSLFHGVGPEKHGISGASPCPEETPWPSFFKVALSAYSKARCCFFSCWEPIITHIVEPSVRERCRTLSLSDPYLVKAAARFIAEKRPELFFIQLDSPDYFGHKYGWGSKKYMKHLTVVDRFIGILVDSMKDAGIFEESIIITVSDHGGIGKKHGTADPECMNIVWGCRGPGINRDAELQNINIMDTPAVIAEALGLKRPKGWDSKLPNNLFKKARPVI